MSTPSTTPTRPFSSSSPLHISTSTSTATSTSQQSTSPTLASPLKRRTMSLTHTYFLAHKARAKLSHEAAQPDHNLRLLVGHANLLDSLMLDLADAEREQESWFNHSVRGASSKGEEKHVRWADSVIEEPEEDWDAEDAESDSDSDSDFYEDEDVEMADLVSMRRVPATMPVASFQYIETYEDDDMEEDDDEEEDYAHLTLTRTPSHLASPPELDHDSDSSEDESMPPSPPTAVLPTFTTEKSGESVVAAAYYDSREEQEDKDAFYDEGFYMPQRHPARLVSAISVY